MICPSGLYRPPEEVKFQEWCLNLKPFDPNFLQEQRRYENKMAR
ncbi:MAG TPA: hypothetical protein VN578_22310 [Candidatus Binatia bacterium]|nr:hypothetical protein [Candidatus Binatia bacterium]